MEEIVVILRGNERWFKATFHSSHVNSFWAYHHPQTQEMFHFPDTPSFVS